MLHAKSEKFILYKYNNPDIHEQWNNFFHNFNVLHFVQHYCWLNSYAKCNPEQAENFFIIVLVDGDTPKAIFPMQYLCTRRFSSNLRTWRIFWPNDMGINDFIFNKTEENHDVLARLISYLREIKEHPWDLLELQNSTEDSCIAYSLEMRALPRHIGIYHHDSKYIECKSNYEESVSNISSKFKRNNRRKRKNLQKIGTISTKYFTNKADLEKAFSEFVRIEAANWKGDNKTALMHDHKQRQFYQKLMDCYSDKGQYGIHIMYLDDKPIAGQLALECGDTLSLLKIGYDAEYHSMGPGGLLLEETIQRFSGHPVINKISFVTGAKWNDNWAPKVLKVYNHYIYNNSIKGLYGWTAETLKSGMRKMKHKLNRQAR